MINLHVMNCGHPICHDHLPSQKDDDPENPKDTTPGAGAGQVEIGKIIFQKQRGKIVSFDLPSGELT